jgi:Fe-S cluster assembly scaffold protein SufB
MGIHQPDSGSILLNGQDITQMDITARARMGIGPHTKGESVHIPVILTQEGLNDVVYNTFEVGEYSDVLIVAGCGIHNAGREKSQHDGIHEFFVRKGSRMKYVEKH